MDGLLAPSNPMPPLLARSAVASLTCSEPLTPSSSRTSVGISAAVTSEAADGEGESRSLSYASPRTILLSGGARSLPLAFERAGMARVLLLPARPLNQVNQEVRSTCLG